MRKYLKYTKYGKYNIYMYRAMLCNYGVIFGIPYGGIPYFAIKMDLINFSANIIKFDLRLG